MSDPPSGDTVVIGVGNPLMGDDGVGIVALERLRDGWTFDPYVELLDGGTWGMNLLPHVERAARLLVIDAIDLAEPAGTPIRLSGAEIPRFLARKLSPHQIDLKEVLALAEFRGSLPDPLVAVGLQPDRVELRPGLSEPVAARVDELLARVLATLGEWGHAARRRAGDGGA